MPTLRHAQNPPDAMRLAALADTCWRSHYIPIIGKAQVDYMLTTFQSAEAIGAQIAAGRHYAFIEDAAGTHGYLAWDHRASELFLSKLYILPASQGQGFGRWAIEDLCRRHPGLDIRLTVNKHNHRSIAFYHCCGFHITVAAVADIGEGFVMDDWIMVRNGHFQSVEYP